MKIGMYDLESPLMNAGGVVKSVEDVRQMAQTGVGAVLAGSFTLEPRIGNSPNGETVYYHDEETGITYNSLGIPNAGLTEMAVDVKEMQKIAHDHGKPFILNFAPMGDDPVEQVIRLSEVLDKAGVTELDGLELNASCPNVVTEDGGRHEMLSHHPEKLGAAVLELSDIAANEIRIGTLIVRVSPLKEPDDAWPLVASLKDAGADAVAAFNTFPNGKPLNVNGDPILQVSGNVGGQSGAGMQHAAEIQTGFVAHARNDLAPSMEIIGSNGITTGEALKRRIDLGASAVSASTIFYQSRRWGEAVDKVLNEFAEL
jgi:dihydroorotate dehydrogenase